MATNERTPTCFLSYSWDSPEHRSWVRHLAAELRSNGVDAILDVFHAPLGADLTHFMGRIAACDFVLVVCTPRFRAKSLQAPGAGGVGYEQAIITGQIFSGTAKPEKFIPILRSGSAAESLPDYLLNRHWADFRDDSRFAQNLELILGAIFAAPEYAMPPIGPRPTFATTLGDLPTFRVRYFEGFDLDDDDPVAGARYSTIWTIGADGPWHGSIRGGLYRLSNTTDTAAVRYGYVGLGKVAGGPLDDLSSTRASVDVGIGEQNIGPFTAAGLLFRFDRSRRFYTGLVLSRHASGNDRRSQLQLVRRDAQGLGLTPLGGPHGMDASKRVKLAITGRGETLDLSVDNEPFRSIPAPGDMRGDPGLLAIGTGDFEFDNFVIADVD
jgi:hypothetical protein